ncbi:MAG: hypothetical protein ABL993_15795 [Vicinamibacterales bacterium]
MTSPRWPVAAIVGAGLIFALLATANAAGYRYGVSDQGFYVSAIFEDLHPGAYPRDRVVLAPQGSLTTIDEIGAAIIRHTGISLPLLCAMGYIAALAGLWAAIWLIGGSLYQSTWSTVALGLALTLRHRVTQTGANTLEGYFHPRMLAFALGALGLAAFLRHRAWTAIALVALAALIHPTTAIWFAVLLGPALVVSTPSLRRPLLAGAAVGAVFAGWALLGPLRPRLAIMDDLWISAFAGKDYVFPTAWPVSTWALNLMLPALIFWILKVRARTATAGMDAGIMAGAAALLACFLISLPFIHTHVALAVQLQSSRVFWLLDLLATIYLTWWLVDRPSATRAATHRRRVVVVALLAALTVGRGGYIVFFEHPERRFARMGLPATDWQDAMDWLRGQPLDTHVLADPNHAFKYSTSVRIGAERDVLLEGGKDSAMALYAREVGVRVVERSAAIGDFAQMTPEHARELAGRYDLDYLVTEADLALPMAYRNAQMRIYSLK